MEFWDTAVAAGGDDRGAGGDVGRLKAPELSGGTTTLWRHDGYYQQHQSSRTKICFYLFAASKVSDESRGIATGRRGMEWMGKI